MGANLGVESFLDVTPPPPQGSREATRARLVAFRAEFSSCLTARRDALFELADALLCAPGRVDTLVGLSLAAEYRRGHGALYDAVNHGQIDVARLSWSLAGLPLPRLHGVITLAVDVSAWLRPDAATSPDRAFCHVYGRGRGRDQYIPGWPYQVLVALGSGRSSWTAPLDARRLRPGEDATVVTATQIRDVHARLHAAGHLHPGDPDVTVVLDAGYDTARLAYLLAGLPIRLIGRIRSDRVMLPPAPARTDTTIGRPRRHGTKMKLADPGTWPAPTTATSTPSDSYGSVTATSWDRMHPRLAHRAAWAEHPGDLPIIEGTLIHLDVDHLPGHGRGSAGMWLWTNVPTSDTTAVTSAWAAYLRRFDEEHTFRFLKQTLGWTRPRLRDPAAADTWTWLVLATYTQLRLAATLTTDLRRPWERRPAPGELLTPARVRRGFRHLRATLPPLTSAPKPTQPGPGRPSGTPNRHRAPHQPVGKQTTDLTTAA